MEDNPLVSVLMGSRNPHWSRLRRAVESLRRQGLQSWELVLWDDGSSPGGTIALGQAAALDPRVRLFRGRQARGLGWALNRCAQRARGRYLARLDDDDLCLPRRLGAQAAFLNAHPAFSWVGCFALRWDGHSLWGVISPPKAPQSRDFLPHSPYVHPGVMFRREALSQVGGYSESPRRLGCEDYDLFLRLHRAGLRGYNLPAPLLLYREDRGSYRRRGPARRLRECALRLEGLPKLGVPPLLAGCSALRPLLACLVPGGLLYRLRRGRSPCG